LSLHRRTRTVAPAPSTATPAQSPLFIVAQACPTIALLIAVLSCRSVFGHFICSHPASHFFLCNRPSPRRHTVSLCTLSNRPCPTSPVPIQKYFYWSIVNLMHSSIISLHRFFHLLYTLHSVAIHLTLRCTAMRRATLHRATPPMLAHSTLPLRPKTKAALPPALLNRCRTCNRNLYRNSAAIPDPHCASFKSDHACAASAQSRPCPNARPFAPALVHLFRSSQSTTKITAVFLSHHK